MLDDDTLSRNCIAYDRDEHTEGISAAGIAVRAAGGHIVAFSVPAPTDRFVANEKRIVAALTPLGRRLGGPARNSQG